MEKFEKLLESSHSLVRAVKDKDFEEPSEIQEKSIPEIIDGKDVVGIASTGSGKTLAFSAGLVKNVKSGEGVQGLVLTPTRELAQQVAKEVLYFSKYEKLNVATVYGGVSFDNQVREIRKADIVVATPGRILDHLKQKTVNFSRVNTLVLDEADRMFDMGFRDDVTAIINYCPKERQTMLFSATMSDDVLVLSKRHMKNPIQISAEPHVDSKKLTQVYYDVLTELKFSLLKNLLENEKAELVMVFCNTRKNVDFLANNLNLMGGEVIGIHGGYSQDKRNKIIKSFHSSKVHILVATDVAARGLDIKGVSHVYNYDIPPTKNEYTHRIGRTARAGKEGKVINIMTGRDHDNFSNIMESGEFNIKLGETPELKKVKVRWIPEEDRLRKRFGGRGGGPSARGHGRGSGGRERGRSFGGRGGERGGREQGRGGSDSRSRGAGRGGRDSARGGRSFSSGGRGGSSGGRGGARDSGRGDRGFSGGRGGRSSDSRSHGAGRRKFNRDDNRGARNERKFKKKTSRRH
tara:strand:+ start:3500 stop:5056 length:1557 start_codon:yes stop_codon:yes gene_type:complete